MIDNEEVSNDEEIMVRCTRSQIEEAMESFFWKDLVHELEAWTKGFEMERGNIVDDAAENNPSTASVLMHMGSIDGRIKAMKYILGIPNLFLDILEERKENKNDS